MDLMDEESTQKHNYTKSEDASTKNEKVHTLI